MENVATYLSTPVFGIDNIAGEGSLTKGKGSAAQPLPVSHQQRLIQDLRFEARKLHNMQISNVMLRSGALAQPSHASLELIRMA